MKLLLFRNSNDEFDDLSDSIVIQCDAAIEPQVIRTVAEFQAEQKDREDQHTKIIKSVYDEYRYIKQSFDLERKEPKKPKGPNPGTREEFKAYEIKKKRWEWQHRVWEYMQRIYLQFFEDLINEAVEERVADELSEVKPLADRLKDRFENAAQILEARMVEHWELENSLNPED